AGVHHQQTRGPCLLEQFVQPALAHPEALGQIALAALKVSASTLHQAHDVPETPFRPKCPLATSWRLGPARRLGALVIGLSRLSGVAGVLCRGSGRAPPAWADTFSSITGAVFCAVGCPPKA